MRPAVNITLAALAAELERKLSFVPPGGERMMMKGTKILFGMLARDADDAAAMRLEEIRELAILLKDSARSCPSSLADRLLVAAEKAAGARDDVRISSLERVLDELRAALVALQAWLEDSTHTDAEQLLARCWDFLVRANAKRVVSERPW